MEELSAVLLLQRVLDDALEQKCTDVHIYTAKNQVVVKFRKDGKLETYFRSNLVGSDIVRRIKALARLDLAESRFPQDGAFHWESDIVHCDVRVSTLPTIHGEAVVMRLFPEQKRPLDFSNLGMNDADSRLLSGMLQTTAGLILVAGPTNSGKTTTLYAMMLYLARTGRKVVSIEDPVERPLEECQQVQVREQIGITFDVGVRAVLRHDPDVIMIGEIRDEKTARAAARAALTGHLVLSTTHAQDTVGALMRLVEFGVPRSLVADVVHGVVVQSFGKSAPSSGDSSGSERTPSFEIIRMTPELASVVHADASWWQVRHVVDGVRLQGNEVGV